MATKPTLDRRIDLIRGALPKGNGNGSKSEPAAPESQAHWMAELANAEQRAWDNLARYKFHNFGYWASWWVKLNQLSGLKLPNPFHDAVLVGRLRTEFPRANPHLRRRDAAGAFAPVTGNGRRGH